MSNNPNNSLLVHFYELDFSFGLQDKNPKFLLSFLTGAKLYFDVILFDIGAGIMTGFNTQFNGIKSCLVGSLGFDFKFFKHFIVRVKANVLSDFYSKSFLSFGILYQL